MGIELSYSGAQWAPLSTSVYRGSIDLNRKLWS